MHNAEVLAVARPYFAVVYEQVVVVAESVALSYHAVAVVKVVLYFVGVAVVCSQGVCVYVVICGSSEQVFHRLIVHAFVCRCDDT